jgi:hypothetical protein
MNTKYEKDIRMNAVQLENIYQYDGFPCNNSKCENGGVCIPILNNFNCKN